MDLYESGGVAALPQYQQPKIQKCPKCGHIYVGGLLAPCPKCNEKK